MSIFAIIFRKWTYNIPIKANIPQDFSRSLTPFALLNVCAGVSRRTRQKARYHLHERSRRNSCRTIRNTLQDAHRTRRTSPQDSSKDLVRKRKELLWSYKEYLIGYPQDSKNLTIGNIPMNSDLSHQLGLKWNILNPKGATTGSTTLTDVNGCT